MRPCLYRYCPTDSVTPLVDGPTAVALGKFESWHLGHQALFETLKRVKRPHQKAIVLTFEPSPRQFFSYMSQKDASFVSKEGEQEGRFYRLSERQELMEASGVEFLGVLRASSSLFALPPQVFVEEILIKRFCAQTVVLGENFYFGAGREGTGETLKHLGRSYGFETHQVPLKRTPEGIPISTYRIRENLLQGRMATVAELLGRSFQISGRVQHGNALGRTIGFPTANISLKQKAFPLNGVYFVQIALGDGEKRWAVANVGVRPHN